MPTRCFYHWNTTLDCIPAATHYQELAGMSGSHNAVRLGLCPGCKEIISESEDVYQIYSLGEAA